MGKKLIKPKKKEKKKEKVKKKEKLKKPMNKEKVKNTKTPTRFAVIMYSQNPLKKIKVIVGEYQKDGSIKQKRIHIGDVRYDDYTTHKDDKRKSLYYARHKKNEDWTFKTGFWTSGYWAKHLLWWKPTIEKSIKALEDNNNITLYDMRY
jgi:hypothetical protein